MANTIIKQLPTVKRSIPESVTNLNISEMFSDTLQGEGVNIGCPATFIRMQHCTLKCVWCDTLDVWKQGNAYTPQEIFLLMDGVEGLIDRLRDGQHLVLTGGSPLKQQHALVHFLHKFIDRYSFLPYVEVENEAVLMPTPELIEMVSCWNNSPKLNNSGMRKHLRHKPDLIKYMAGLKNSWFKFVVSDKAEWNEIEKEYLPHIVNRNKIILMPEADDIDRLNNCREYVADICNRENVRFSDRLHITLWNKKTGV